MSIVFIVSAPSGSGKSTIVQALLSSDPRLLFSISYTTRAPRGSERDGVDYNFIKREDFEDRVRKGEFLEHAEVFGNYYGTHRGFAQTGAPRCARHGSRSPQSPRSDDRRPAARPL